MNLDDPKFSPKATCLWAKLNEPDTKFKDTGVFSIDLVLDPGNPEHEAFMEAVNDLTEAYAEEQIKGDKKKKNWKLNSKFKEQLDEEGDPTGMFTCRLSQNAEFHSTRKNKTYYIKNIPIIDAGRKPAQEAKIGNGSTVRVKFETRGYGSAKDKEFGLTMDLKMVQVVTLIEHSGGANVDGFDEEDGFDSSVSGSEGFESENPAPSNEGQGGDF